MSDDPEGELIRGLRAIAGLNDGDTFAVKTPSAVVNVSYSCGSSNWLRLSARYDTYATRELDGSRAAAYRTSAARELVSARPLAIELVPESLVHVHAKARGINREHQTNDPEFDRDVYVDSPTVDDAVLRAVLGDDARSASRALFALGLRRIIIDDENGDVIAHLTEFATAKENPNRAELIVEAFAKLLVSLPPVKASGATHDVSPFDGLSTKVTAVILAILFCVTSPAFNLLTHLFHCTVTSEDGETTSLAPGCGAAPLYGLTFAVVAGLLAVAVVIATFAPKLRGRSDSASMAARVGLLSFGVAASVTFLVVTLIGFAIR